MKIRMYVNHCCYFSIVDLRLRLPTETLLKGM